MNETIYQSLTNLLSKGTEIIIHNKGNKLPWKARLVFATLANKVNNRPELLMQ